MTEKEFQFKVDPNNDDTDRSVTITFSNADAKEQFVITQESTNPNIAKKLKDELFRKYIMENYDLDEDVLAGLSICFLGNYPAMAVQRFFGMFGYEAAGSLTNVTTWQEFALEFFSTAIVVPVMEEFAFRGVLFSGLKKHGTAFAVVDSALVFSFLHLDFSNVLFALIAGLVFGFLYAKTKNLWLTILIHALNNGYAVFP